MATLHRPARDKKLEVRVSGNDLDLIDRAAQSVGLDRSSFVSTNVRIAAQNALANSVTRSLSPEATAEMERILSEPVRELAGIRALAQEPSPFTDRPTLG